MSIYDKENRKAIRAQSLFPPKLHTVILMISSEKGLHISANFSLLPDNRL